MFRWLSRIEKETLDDMVRKERRKRFENASAIADNNFIDHQLEIFKHFTSGRIMVSPEDMRTLIGAKNIINQKRNEIIRRSKSQYIG